MAASCQDCNIEGSVSFGWQNGADRAGGGAPLTARPRTPVVPVSLNGTSSSSADPHHAPPSLHTPTKPPMPHTAQLYNPVTSTHNTAAPSVDHAKQQQPQVYNTSHVQAPTGAGPAGVIHTARTPMTSRQANSAGTGHDSSRRVPLTARVHTPTGPHGGHHSAALAGTPRTGPIGLQSTGGGPSDPVGNASAPSRTRRTSEHSHTSTSAAVTGLDTTIPGDSSSAGNNHMKSHATASSNGKQPVYGSSSSSVYGRSDYPSTGHHGPSAPHHGGITGRAERLSQASTGASTQRPSTAAGKYTPMLGYYFAY